MQQHPTQNSPWFIRLLAWPALVLYAVSLLLYSIPPANWWPMGIIGIGWPYLWFAFAALLLLLYRYRFAYRKFWLYSWCMGIIVMSNVWAVHPFAKKWAPQQAVGSLRIMQWNCEQLSGIDTFYHSLLPGRKEAEAFIRNANPDIIVMQDFQDYKSDALHSNIAFFRDTLGYAFMHFAPYFKDVKPWGVVEEGVVIFSKQPFLRSGKVQYPQREYAPYIAWADVLYNNKPVRIATTHFISMHLNLGVMPADTFGFILQQDTSVLVTGSKLKKLRYYQAYHTTQAQTLRAFVDTCTVPVVLGADLNSVPTSYVYRKVKGPLQDAFLETGFGWGKTYRKSNLPNLRIDYLLHHPQLQVLQMHSPTLRISDHKPLLADFRWL